MNKTPTKHLTFANSPTICALARCNIAVELVPVDLMDGDCLYLANVSAGPFGKHYRDYHFQLNLGRAETDRELILSFIEKFGNHIVLANKYTVAWYSIERDSDDYEKGREGDCLKDALDEAEATVDNLKGQLECLAQARDAIK